MPKNKKAVIPLNTLLDLLSNIYQHKKTFDRTSDSDREIVTAERYTTPNRGVITISPFILKENFTGTGGFTEAGRIKAFNILSQYLPDVVKKPIENTSTGTNLQNTKKAETYPPKKKFG